MGRSKNCPEVKRVACGHTVGGKIIAIFTDPKEGAADLDHRKILVFPKEHRLPGIFTRAVSPRRARYRTVTWGPSHAQAKETPDLNMSMILI